MRQFLIKIHLWLSLPFGLIFLLLCITGSLLVFRSEVEDWQRTQLLQLDEHTGTLQSLAVLHDAAQAALPDSLTLGAVTIPAARDQAYSYSIKELRGGQVVVNPYTAEVLAVQEAGSSFFTTVMRLHRWLLMPFKRGEFSTGRFITGVTTIISTIILLTGIIIWLPKSRKSLKRRLTVKRQKGQYRFWYDLHLAGGIYSSLFLLVFCLTGLTWSFSWYRDAFYAVFGVKQEQHGPPAHQQGSNNRQAKQETAPTAIQWDAALASIQAQAPHYSSITLDAGTAQVAPPDGNRRRADRYTFDRATGEITGLTRWEDSIPESRKFHIAIYSFHVGSWGGLWTKILSFIACLIGSLLAGTGYYMYFKKLQIKTKKRQPLTVNN